MKIKAVAIFLIISIFLFPSCKTKPPVLIPVGDARVVVKLPNGNFEVTPGFIVEFKTRGDEIELLKLEIKKLEERGDKEQ